MYRTVCTGSGLLEIISFTEHLNRMLSSNEEVLCCDFVGALDPLTGSSTSEHIIALTNYFFCPIHDIFTRISCTVVVIFQLFSYLEREFLHIQISEY